jgi:hypothetical protein
MTTTFNQDLLLLAQGAYGTMDYEQRWPILVGLLRMHFTQYRDLTIEQMEANPAPVIALLEAARRELTPRRQSRMKGGTDTLGPVFSAVMKDLSYWQPRTKQETNAYEQWQLAVPGKYVHLRLVAPQQRRNRARASTTHSG